MAVKTHIGKIREKYTYNRQCILTALGWDEDAYNNAWIDMGRAYVETQYPANDPRYARHNHKARNDSRYWSWWLLEWKHRESTFIKMFQGEQEVEAKDYISVMSCLLSCYATDKSFELNYLQI